MRVSVIIVNYGTADLVIAGVESVISRDHGGHDVDVHVVDNASPGDDGARLTSAAVDWPSVTVYAEAENHGFGRANNLVFEVLSKQDTPPDYVFLLNPDARLQNDAITRLVAFLEANQRVAVAGAKIVKPGTGTRIGAFRFPGIFSEFSQAVAFGPISRLFSRFDMAMDPELEQQRVDWVPGAAMMARFEVIEQIGRFDPAFFLYYEEVDLMHRIAEAGHETWYIPSAVVDHDEGVATGATGVSEARRRKPEYWYWSWQYYMRKSHGRLYAICAASAWMKGAALNHLIAKIRGRQAAAPLNFFGDFWAMAIRPLLGLKPKPY